MSKNNLPSVTSDIPKDLRYFIDRVRETLNQSGKNRFVTVSDLKNIGVIDTTPDGDPRPPADEDNNITPVLKPPVPTGLEATGGYEFITLTWDTPSYYGHGYTEVYRVTGDTLDFTNEELVATVTGFTSIFSDYVGTGQTFSYRIRFVNIMDVQGDPSDPVTASTALDVEELLEVLTGNISNTQLNQELAGSLFGDDGLQGKITEVRDDVNGLYVLKVAADGKVAGFGLSVEEGEAFFAAQADRFWLSPPPDYVSVNNPYNSQGSNGQVWYNSATKVYYLKVSGTWEVFESPFPFIVQTTPVTIDDVDVPPGVYINDAYIKNATITTAMIKTAAIDTARIVNGAVTNAKIGFLDAGKIVTGRLQSPNFDNTAGRAGFLLSMGVGATDFTPTLDAEGNIQFDNDGNIIGTFDGYRQEDVTFILRSKLLTEPALQLLDGTVTINALAIRRALRSVSWTEQPNRFGFEIDVDNGTVKFRDGTGDNVFEIVDGNSKGIVKMTGAAIRDYIQSYNYDSFRPGFQLNTGQAYNGSTNDPVSFYLRGKNGRILLAVDGDTEQLAEQIDNSFVTQALIQGNLVANPLMTERDYRFGDPTPRGWYVSSTTIASVLKYADASNSILRIDKTETQSLLNPYGDTSIDLTGTIFRVDPNVKKYRVKLRWRVVEGDIVSISSGISVRMYYSNFTPSSARTLTESSSHPYDSEEVATRSGRDNLYVVTADNPSSEEGDIYNAAKPSALNTWHEAELEWRNPKGEYATLSILNWLGLGSGAIVDIDYAVVEPVEQTATSIVNEDGVPLSPSRSAFAWLQDKITENNIDTYIDKLAVREAYIANAAVQTLKIGENAVTIPEGESGDCSIDATAGSWQACHVGMEVESWTAETAPNAFIVTAQTQWLGTLMNGTTTASEATSRMDVQIDWKDEFNNWSADHTALWDTTRSTSMIRGSGGQVTSMTHVPVPAWAKSARFTVRVNSSSGSRGVSFYSISVLGAKR